MAQSKLNDLISQYIPEFYEKQHGKTNIVTVSGEVLNKIVTDIRKFQMNNWDKIEILETEFKASEVITSGFRIRQPEFLKSFFRFKGTNADLKYILSNIGYTSTIYNDGGIQHRDNKDETTEIVELPTSTNKANPCQLEIQIQLDLNSPLFDGFETIDIGPIKDIINNRISLCSYLNKISIAILVEDAIDMDNIQDEFEIEIRPAPFEDNFFDEYGMPHIKYGKKFNDNLKYGAIGENLAPYYGQHNIKFFRPLTDYVEITRRCTYELDETLDSENVKDDIQIPEMIFEQFDTEQQVKEYIDTKLAHTIPDEEIPLHYRDAILTHPEVESDSALPIKKFGRKYFTREHTMTYGQSPVQAFYNEQDMVTSPSAEQVISINGVNEPDTASINDDIEIFIRRENGTLEKI